MFGGNKKGRKQTGYSTVKTLEQKLRVTCMKERGKENGNVVAA